MISVISVENSCLIELESLPRKKKEGRSFFHKEQVTTQKKGHYCNDGMNAQNTLSGNIENQSLEKDEIPLSSIHCDYLLFFASIFYLLQISFILCDYLSSIGINFLFLQLDCTT